MLSYNSHYSNELCTYYTIKSGQRASTNMYSPMYALIYMSV